MKILSGILLLFAALNVSAMTPEEAIRLLDDEQGLVLKKLAPLSGRAVRIDGDQLIFVAKRGGGTLEYRYKLDEIERLQFPGNEVAFAVTEYLRNKDYKQALPLMRALFLQRQHFLALVTPGELNFFYQYVELEFRHGDPYLALGRGQAVLYHSQDPVLIRQLEDLVLLGYYRLPLQSNTRELAEVWTQKNEPYGATALGFYVLGRLEFDAENYDAALMYALEPIAFSSQFPMDYLGYCYALAIAASVELEEAEEETRLRTEMTLRGLAWPMDIEDLANYQQPTQTLTEAPES